MVMVLRKLRRLAVVAPPALVLAIGCRAILGIEQHQYNPLNCTVYCDTIMTTCIGANSQYTDMDTCLGFCSALPPGTLDDDAGNTLGCRLNQAMIAQENTDCAIAGPGGDGTCGSNCESLCTVALVNCPEDFSSMSSCMAVCHDLLECPAPYNAVPGGTTPDDPSVECRLWHLGAASAGLPSNAGAPPEGGTAAQIEHCPHVIGVEYCALPTDGGKVCTGSN
jgi:hypothetical protein